MFPSGPMARSTLRIPLAAVAPAPDEGRKAL